MFYQHGYSQPIGYTSYYPRLTKPDILTSTDTENSQIIKLLESFGKKVTDFGGLDIGIAYDDRTVIKKRLASDKANEYVIIYEKTYGSPEQVFKTFKELQKELNLILKNPDDAKDRQQVAALNKILKKHGSNFKNEGWRNKISFGKNNLMYKKVTTNSLVANVMFESGTLSGSFNDIMQYYTFYWMLQGSTQFPLTNFRNLNGAITLDGGSSYQTTDFNQFCKQLDTYIIDNSEK